MSSVMKLSQRSCFISVLNKTSQEENVTITYKNMIKIFTLSEILGRCVLYLEEKMLNDFTLLFTLKTQICLADLMYVSTEKKRIVPLALAFGMSYIL